MSKTTTEKLLDELNDLKGLSYPDKGYSYFADIRGDGQSMKSVYTILNDKGGVFRNNVLNGSNARVRCNKIRQAIKLARWPIEGDSRYQISYCYRGQKEKTFMAYFCDKPISGKVHHDHRSCEVEILKFNADRENALEVK